MSTCKKYLSPVDSNWHSRLPCFCPPLPPCISNFYPFKEKKFSVTKHALMSLLLKKVSVSAVLILTKYFFFLQRKS